MLELYFADRSVTALPENLHGLQHAGSIDFDSHRALYRTWYECELAGLRLSYFEDTLLSVEHIERMLAIFDARAGQPGSDHRAFAVVRSMLVAAADKGDGLVAFCD
jgi:hypothetical protein